MRKALHLTIAMISLGAGGLARAQGAPPAPAPSPFTPPGLHAHDGFFLQMDLGLGGMTSKLNGPGGELELSGAAGEFSIGVGYAVVPNLVLAGQLWGVAVSGPDVKLNGQTLGTATDATQSLSGVGLNVTYYFMPVNVYVSATPSVGTLSIEEGGQTLDSKSGFAIRLAVGKEWWVSTNWGLGLNVQYIHSSNEPEGTSSATWGTNWFGAAFSATYN